MNSLTKLLATGVLASSLLFSSSCSKKDSEINQNNKAKDQKEIVSGKKSSLESLFVVEQPKYEYLDIPLDGTNYLRFVKIPGGEYPLDNGGVERVQPYWLMETEFTRQQARAIENEIEAEKQRIYEKQNPPNPERDKYYTDMRHNHLMQLKGLTKQQVIQMEEELKLQLEREKTERLKKEYEERNFPEITTYKNAQVFIDYLSKKFFKEFELPNQFQFHFALTEGNPLDFFSRIRPIYEKGNILSKDKTYDLMEIKSFPANSFGIYDLIGNAEEIIYPKIETLQGDTILYTGGSYRSDDQTDVLRIKKPSAGINHKPYSDTRLGFRLVINE